MVLVLVLVLLLLWLASVFTLVLVLRQSSENRSIIIPEDVKMSQAIDAYINKTNFYVKYMHWDNNGILDGFIDHKQNTYPSNNECDIRKSICDKLFNKYKKHDFKWSNQSYTSIASSLYKHMCVYIPERTEGHFACSCVHPLNDNSVGASNLMAGNRKLV